MNNGEHDDFVLRLREEDAIWKAADEGSPIAGLDFGKQRRSGR
jgi:hypothetical protein